MTFNLLSGSCFVTKRNNDYLLVVDEEYIKDINEVKVGMIVEFTEVIQIYKVNSVYYDSVNGIYVLGFEENKE